MSTFVNQSEKRKRALQGCNPPGIADRDCEARRMAEHRRPPRILNMPKKTQPNNQKGPLTTCCKTGVHSNTEKLGGCQNALHGFLALRHGAFLANVENCFPQIPAGKISCPRIPFDIIVRRPRIALIFF